MSDKLQEQLESLSHEELLEITESSLRRLIASDALLKDLPVDVTIEEVNAQVAVVRGQSITVTILRSHEAPLNVVIPQIGTTVLALKKAIERSFNLKQKRLKSRTKISWRYVWRTYHLQVDGRTMRNGNELVATYGVRNKSEISFVKRLRKH